MNMGGSIKDRERERKGERRKLDEKILLVRGLTVIRVRNDFNSISLCRI
jgi:hypothetical protein